MKRILWIDALKGFGIIMVMVGHVISNQSMFSKGIYAFHMPLFFFLSGYVYNTGSSGTAKISRRICSLGVPYVFYSLLFYFLGLASENLYSILGGCFSDILIGKGISVTWFLCALLFVDLLGGLIVRSFKTTSIILTASIAGLIALLFAQYSKGCFVSINIILAMLPFWCVGYIIKLHGILGKIFNVQKGYFCLIVIVLCLTFFCFIINDLVNVKTCEYGKIYLFYPIEFSGVFLLMLIAQRIPEFCNKMLAYFGMRSLLYMVLHLPIIAISKVLLSGGQLCYRMVAILFLVGVVEVLYRWVPFSYGKFAIAKFW